VPAAAGPDDAQLLDVDVDQFAGPGTFIAADQLPGGAVQPGQPVHAVPTQDGVHGGGRQADQRADPRRSQLPFRAQRQHLRLEPGRSLARQAMGPTGPVKQTGGAFGSPASQPLVAGRARDVELDHDMRDWAAQLDNPADEFGTAVDRQAGISVGHETSGHSGVASATHTFARRSPRWISP
jgi:hypothetical protein